MRDNDSQCDLPRSITSTNHDTACVRSTPGSWRVSWPTVTRPPSRWGTHTHTHIHTHTTHTRTPPPPPRCWSSSRATWPGATPPLPPSSNRSSHLKKEWMAANGRESWRESVRFHKCAHYVWEQWYVRTSFMSQIQKKFPCLGFSVSTCGIYFYTE